MIQCPYLDCRYEPGPDDPKFRHIKTHKEKNSTLRGWECPKCGRSFTEEGKLVAEPYYQRERNADRNLSTSAS